MLIYVLILSSFCHIYVLFSLTGTRLPVALLRHLPEPPIPEGTVVEAAQLPPLLLHADAVATTKAAAALLRI